MSVVNYMLFVPSKKPFKVEGFFTKGAIIVLTFLSLSVVLANKIEIKDKIHGSINTNNLNLMRMEKVNKIMSDTTSLDSPLIEQGCCLGGCCQAPTTAC